MSCRALPPPAWIPCFHHQAILCTLHSIHHWQNCIFPAPSPGLVQLHRKQANLSFQFFDLDCCCPRDLPPFTYSIMPRCHICSKFSLEMLLPIGKKVKHHSSSDKLIESAKDCDICALFLEMLKEELQRKGHQHCGQIILSPQCSAISLMTKDPEVHLKDAIKICTWTGRSIIMAFPS